MLRRYRSSVGFNFPLELRVVTIWGKARTQAKQVNLSLIGCTAELCSQLSSSKPRRPRSARITCRHAWEFGGLELSECLPKLSWRSYLTSGGAASQIRKGRELLGWSGPCGTKRACAASGQVEVLSITHYTFCHSATPSSY